MALERISEKDEGSFPSLSRITVIHASRSRIIYRDTHKGFSFSKIKKIING